MNPFYCLETKTTDPTEIRKNDSSDIWSDAVLKKKKTAVQIVYLDCQGMCYKAAVVAQRHLKDRVVGFSILASDATGRPLAMQEFSIRTAR